MYIFRVVPHMTLWICSYDWLAEESTVLERYLRCSLVSFFSVCVCVCFSVTVQWCGYARITLLQFHPSVATLYNNLGNVLRQQGRLNEALEMYEKARSIFEAAYGINHPTLRKYYSL